MNEAEFTSKFNTWLKYQDDYWGAFELKICHEDSMQFSRVAEHQLSALNNVNNNHLIYKLPDTGFSQLPFDVFKMQKCPAYIVVMFYRRGQKTFYIIPIDSWMEHLSITKRKSLMELDASEIGYTCKLA